MATVVLDMAMSVDGFVAGPNDEPGGLHDYFFSPSPATATVLAKGLATTGAIIMGKRTYELGAAQDGFVDNPYKVPHFVLTHTVPDQPARGAETFIFVTSGIRRALMLAQAAAGDNDVVIGGGASIAQQFLHAGLVDEIHLHLVPTLLGAGRRLFDGIGGASLPLEPVSLVGAPEVTHLRFRVVR